MKLEPKFAKAIDTAMKTYYLHHGMMYDLGATLIKRAGSVDEAILESEERAINFKKGCQELADKPEVMKNYEALRFIAVSMAEYMNLYYKIRGLAADVKEGATPNEKIFLELAQNIGAKETSFHRAMEDVFPEYTLLKDA